MAATLESYGMWTSMSRKGDCWDNAPPESFCNSLKNEWAHGARYSTRTEAKVDLFEDIEVFFSRSRRHSTLGYRSRVGFLKDWILTLPPEIVSLADVLQSKQGERS